MSMELESLDEVSNPLDSVEEIMHSQDWSFTRTTPDELTVQVSGRQGVYNLTFIWQEEYAAMQFFCEYDLYVPRERMTMACQLLKDVNEQVWLGHFDIPSANGIPCFRHTTLFSGMTHVSGADHVRDLLEIGIAESERYYNAFSMLSSSTYLDNDLMTLALTESKGEA